jgi:hypothetical protein
LRLTKDTGAKKTRVRLHVYTFLPTEVVLILNTTGRMSSI